MFELFVHCFGSVQFSITSTSNECEVIDVMVTLSSVDGQSTKFVASPPQGTSWRCAGLASTVPSSGLGMFIPAASSTETIVRSFFFGHARAIPHPSDLGSKESV